MSAGASSINPNVNSGSFQQGLTVASNTVSDAEGMRKISAFATALITAVGEILIEIPEGLTELATRLEDSSKVLSFFNFISHIKWWICEEKKSWQHTLSMISFTAQQALDAAKFLEKVKAIDLSAISATIGSIPVLGLVSGLLGGTASVFGAWHDGRKISELNEELRAKRDELDNVQGDIVDCASRCQRAVGSVQERCQWLQNYISKDEVEEISLTFKENANEKLKEFATKKLAHRVKKLEVEIANCELEKTKSKISLLSNIASVALDILTLIGICASVSALSITGWPMIVLGLVVAGIGVYEYLYDKNYEKQALPEKDPLLVFVENAITVNFKSKRRKRVHISMGT